MKLLEAVRLADELRVVELLNANVDPNFQTAEGATPLSEAAGLSSWYYQRTRQELPTGRDLNIVRALLDHGADVNRFGPVFGSTADVARILIAAGANVNAQGGGLDQTALMRYADAGHVSIVEVLLSHGANPNLRDNANRTALDIVVTKLESSFRYPNADDLRKIADLLRARMNR